MSRPQPAASGIPGWPGSSPVLLVLTILAACFTCDRENVTTVATLGLAALALGFWAVRQEALWAAYVGSLAWSGTGLLGGLVLARRLSFTTLEPRLILAALLERAAVATLGVIGGLLKNRAVDGRRRKAGSPGGMLARARPLAIATEQLRRLGGPASGLAPRLRNTTELETEDQKRVYLRKTLFDVLDERMACSQGAAETAAYQHTGASHSRSSKVSIGRYELQDVLGGGGQGVVYKALQRGAVEQSVAVKTLRAEGLAAEGDVAKFLQELRLMTELEHPGLVSILDPGIEAGRPFLAMPLMVGASLTGRLKDVGLPDPQTAARWMTDIARAVD